MKRPQMFALPVVILALVVAACGKQDQHEAQTASQAMTATSAAATSVRSVDIEMADIRFEPTAVRITKGETVKFVFRNVGVVAHDAVIGDAAAQAAHEKQMSAGGGAMHHEDGDAITVQPGTTGTLTRMFDAAGTFEIGCHEPGHYGAGMRVILNVA